MVRLDLTWINPAYEDESYIPGEPPMEHSSPVVARPLSDVANSATGGEAPTAAATECYHCGESIAPAARSCTARRGGVERVFCCAGCRAVAAAIAGAGLEAFYAERTARGRPLDAVAVAPDFESRAGEAGLVRDLADGTREATLLLEGIRCAACVWLNEAVLAREPGVIEARINYQTRRAHVRWRPDQASLGGLLAVISAIGYRAYPYDPARHEAIARRESRALLRRAAIAMLAMMQVMMLASPAYLTSDGVEPAHESLFRWASLILTAPTLAYAGWPFLGGAWRSIRNRQAGMDVPIALGLVVAFGASVHATLAGGGPVYFDSITMFLALLLASRWFELRSRQRAADAVERLTSGLPVSAERLAGYPSSRAPTPVGVSALVPGDIVLVRSGATIPADGSVIEGASHVDESLLTGESWAVAKGLGARVFAGSINREGTLLVRVEAVTAASRINGIVRLVERAGRERPAIAALADRIARVATASVLVVSCPCALSLAVPSALAGVTDSLARRGILVTRGHAIETLSKVTDVVFDKTGTLTTGRFTLVGVITTGGKDRGEALAIAAALERDSEHPLAAAIRGAAGARAPFAAGEAVGLVSIAGHGIEGRVGGRHYRLGRPEWVGALHGRPVALESRLIADHVTPIALGDEAGWCAWFTFSDELRAGSLATVWGLKDAGLRIHVLSGDRDRTVRHWAGVLGADSARGELTPEGKLEHLREIAAPGRVVMMVGDGVNDAPVLARAHVSVAMASGAPLAMVTADVVLLASAPMGVLTAIERSRKAQAIVRWNFAWALAYNAIAIPAAAMGLVSPLLATAGMSLSSLLVVLNSLRLAPTRTGEKARDPDLQPDVRTQPA